MTARDIEYWLARRHFSYIQWTVVPRTYQVLGYECDLLALTRAGYAHEVEIKISLSDVKADQQKEHHRGPHPLIKCFWFAMPEDLVERAEPFIPAHAGILAVDRNGMIREHRLAPVNKIARAWTFAERYQLVRSLMFRFWQDVAARRAV